MKSILNELKFIRLYFLPLLISFLMVSCQDEIVEISNPSTQDTIVPNSNLANLMKNTAALDGSVDNILDAANCLTLELPVTVVVNGVEIFIDSLSDLELIEAIIELLSTDNDTIDIMFPVVIILNDYTEIVINNAEELQSHVDECLGENEPDDDIECIDFHYPIVFSVYNSSFQVIDTISIDNDEALYDFIENLEGGILASLNFPVTLVLSNGSTVEVGNNEELEAVIAAAEDDCDEDDDYDWNDDDVDCTAEFVALAIKECIWQIAAYNANDILVGLDLDFDPNYGFTVSENGNELYNGSWSITENNSHLVLNLATDFQDINGEWWIIECEADRFALIQQTAAGAIEMIIEQYCPNNNPFQCYDGTDFELLACDGDTLDGIALFDLTQAFPECANPTDLAVHYFTSLADAQAGINGIANPQAYTNTSNPQTIYIKVALVSDVNNFGIFEMHLVVEDCNSPSCTELAVDDYLQTCIWSVVNYNGSDMLIIYDFDFNSDTTVSISGNGASHTANWSTSESVEGVLLSFSNLNAPNIQALTGTWLITECDPDRLALVMEQDSMVMEQDCAQATVCSESEVDAILQQCEWIISSYANSNDFNIFNIHFTSLQDLIVYTPNATEEYTANWSTSQSANGVEVILSNISGGNVQVLNGTYTVVECTANQIILHDVTNSNNELVLDQICN